MKQSAILLAYNFFQHRPSVFLVVLLVSVAETLGKAVSPLKESTINPRSTLNNNLMANMSYISIKIHIHTHIHVI